MKEKTFGSERPQFGKRAEAPLASDDEAFLREYFQDLASPSGTEGSFVPEDRGKRFRALLETNPSGVDRIRRKLQERPKHSTEISGIVRRAEGRE